MSKVLCVAIVSVVVATSAWAGEAGKDGGANWGQWRGPEGSGLSPGGKPPVEWSEGNHVRWKIEVPGEGLSAPIVWGELVFVQTAIKVKKADEEEGAGEAKAEAVEEPRRGDRGRGGEREGGRRGRRGGRWGGRGAKPTSVYQFVVLALDRATGRQVWDRVVREEVPHEGSHRDGSLAPASPLTDGEHVYAYFGSRGLYCLTMEGEVVWEKDLGEMRTRNGFGEGSSPVLHGDTLVVNWDHEDDSFIVALDKKTGAERWRREREEASSWATPLIVEDGGRAQVVVSGSRRVRGYDLGSGEPVWECGGLGTNCVPSPLAGGGFVYAMSGHREPALLAIRYEGAKGDLTESDSVAWRLDGGTPYVPSPILYGNALYFTQKNSGILSCYNAKTGKPYYDQQRLEEMKGVYASLVGADDRVYVVGRNGVTYVVKRGAEFEVLAINKLDESFSASPAIAGNELYLRGRKHLYCIATQ